LRRLAFESELKHWAPAADREDEDREDSDREDRA